MHVEELFEKREKGQLSLVASLMNATGPVSLKELVVETDLSRSTLLKYIEDLNGLAQEVQFELRIDLDNDQLALQMGPHVTKEEVIQLLLPFSVKVQILNFLYLKDEFTVQKLAQALTMSEATLHRQLATLNASLEEFGLSIKNGRLRGEEHQIRYFYYQLYWLIVPKKQMAQQFGLAQFQSLIEAMKIFGDTSMSANNQYKLALWFAITKQRIGTKHKDFKQLKHLMKPYVSHRFFQQVRQHMLRYLSRFALEVEEEETMCHFLFITTQSILSPHVMERNLGYGGPVSEATTLGLKFIRTVVATGENLNEQALYTLNQVLGQLYFFKGSLIDRHYRLENDLAFIASGMSLDHADLAQEMIDEVLMKAYGTNVKSLGHLWTKSRWTITEVLSFVVYQSPKQIHIGLALSGFETRRLPVLTVLRQQLEINRQVTLEWWHESQSFDFVISNIYHESYPVPFYYLKGTPNAFDIQQIEQIIKHQLKLST